MSPSLRAVAGLTGAMVIGVVLYKAYDKENERLVQVEMARLENGAEAMRSPTSSMSPHK